MRHAASLAVMALVGGSLFVTASTAAASGHSSGDGNVTAVAVNTGSGSATATANGAGQPTLDDSSPVVGDPASGTIQIVGSSINTINVTVSYSCPTGSPADAFISAQVIQGQAIGTPPSSLSATCDGSLRTLVLPLSPPSAPFFKPGPATIKAFLLSQSVPGFNQIVTSQVTL
ncbi:hypothetical protein [Streptomyces sp. ADI96-02]|uniref:hypothetical protein n=1 Tax=Streptomyces sp. ADI96-02 TaxID=1522760 RepID=UPI000F54CE46|nr:hypothetical protein [Streptomyces sp. ADI96-02]